jgi:DNA-binding response OmpR family regulator
MTQRILIIDDEENIRRVTRLTLQAAGYEVGEAADGERGLEAFGDGSTWDAVLLDQRMPGMDGLEVLRQIKERQPGACVIMSTAYASIELAVDAMKLGATDFVRKPMTPEVLRNAVAAALAKSEAAAAETTLTSAADETVARRPLIQTLTMNGFEITRPTDEQGSPVLELDQHRFIVRSPDGKEHEVIVKIDAEAVGYVERMTRRRLPASSGFWALRAERLLSNFLWTEGKPPISGRLTLTEVDRDELMWAERWEDD